MYSKITELFPRHSLTEVNDMDDVLTLAQPDQEVIRLHVPVDEALCVNVLQSAQQLDTAGEGK